MIVGALRACEQILFFQMVLEAVSRTIVVIHIDEVKA